MGRICTSLVGRNSEQNNSTVPSSYWRDRLLRMPDGPIAVSFIPCWQWPTSAMAKVTRRRETLAAAEQSINQWTQEMLDRPVGVMPLPWFDWIECLVLFREASIVITGYAPPDDPRLRIIEQRAQNALQDSGTSLVP